MYVTMNTTGKFDLPFPCNARVLNVLKVMPVHFKRGVWCSKTSNSSDVIFSFKWAHQGSSWVPLLWLKFCISGHSKTTFTGSSIYICPPFDASPILSQLIQERFMYLFRKLWVVAINNSYEIGSKSVMEGSRWVLVKVLGLYFLHWTLKNHHS